MIGVGGRIETYEFYIYKSYEMYICVNTIPVNMYSIRYNELNILNIDLLYS